jgi:hypothetical protein
MAGRVKKIQLQFRSFEDGVNMTDPRSDIGARYLGKAEGDAKNGLKQVTSCLDFMLHKKKPRPAVKALTNTIPSACRGFGIYQRNDGSETMLVVSAGKLYSINPSTGAQTELYNMGGTGEAWFESYMDRAFVCNGNKAVKVEGETAYQLGLNVPAGITATTVTGGTLPAGIYKIYAGYSKETDLFGRGISLGSVTVASPKLTIRVYGFAESTDPQVTKKTIWMTDAGGAVYYLYKQFDNDAADSYDITSAADRNTAYIYEVDAMQNYPVPAFSYLKCFNNYLYGTVDNTLYRSLQYGNVHDLERFYASAAGNIATYPFAIRGIFDIGSDLYLNTVGGIIKIPNGDYNNPIDIKQGYFEYPRTVVEWSQGLLGLTKRGFRYFDGERMTDVDVSYDIKSVVDKMIAGASDNSMPCGAIIKDNDRLQYWVSYRDLSAAGNGNNRSAVLNLDKFYFSNDNTVRAPWELWSVGFNYLVNLADGTWYGLQSENAASVIFKKYASKNVDTGVYYNGAIVAERAYGWMLRTATIIPALIGRIRCLSLWAYIRIQEKMYAKVVIDSDPEISETYEFDRNPGADVYDTALWDTGEYALEGTIDRKKSLSARLKGKGVYLELSQTARDDDFEILESTIECSYKEGRFV